MTPRADHGGGWRPPRNPQYFPWHWLLIYCIMLVMGVSVVFSFYSMMWVWSGGMRSLIFLRA